MAKVNRLLAKHAFFVAGSGEGQTRLEAFEKALISSGGKHPFAFNLVTFSSILPAFCTQITPDEGFKMLDFGQIVFSVRAEQATNVKGEIATASLGIARLKNPNNDKDNYGYISETHSNSMTQEESAAEARRLATTFLADSRDLNVSDLDLDVDEAVAASIKNTKGNWVCALAICMFVMPE